MSKEIAWSIGQLLGKVTTESQEKAARDKVRVNMYSRLWVDISNDVSNNIYAPMYRATRNLFERSVTNYE